VLLCVCLCVCLCACRLCGVRLECSSGLNCCHIEAPQRCMYVLAVHAFVTLNSELVASAMQKKVCSCHSLCCSVVSLQRWC
jgi:hypothetical protein